MLVHLLSLSNAFALQCDPADAPCNDANALRDLVDAHSAGAITDGHPKARRRTETLRERLTELYAELDAAGCDRDGFTAGVYNRSQLAGDWTRDGGQSGDVVGSYASPGFTGAYTGTDAGTIGDYGVFQEQRYAGLWGASEAFVAGGFVQIQGSRGAVWGVLGTCPGDIAASLEGYVPKLSEEVSPVVSIVRAGGISWPDALIAATGPSTHLATVTSTKQAAWVQSLAPFAGGNLWLGASRAGVGAFEWVTGAPFLPLNWAPGEPSDVNEGFLEIWGSGVRSQPMGRWNDVRETNGFNTGYLLQHDPVQVAPVVDPATGHRYLRVRGEYRTWNEANDAASSMFYRGMRGHLVTITSQAEQDFLGDAIGWDNLWIGGFQETFAPDFSEPAGGWRWVTGEAFAFENWAGSEPSNGPPTESWLAVHDGGVWNDIPDVWNFSPRNAGFIVEFEPTPAVRHVAQQDDPSEFRSIFSFHMWDLSDDGVYGTDGYVFYTTGPDDGTDPGVLEHGVDPLTYAQDGLETVADLPSYVTVENNGQSSVLAFGNRPVYDDPTEPVSPDVPNLAAGSALRNNVPRGELYTVADLVFTQAPPATVRVGIYAEGSGEDAMAAIELTNVDTGASAIAHRTGSPSTYVQFFDIEGASVGDRYTISIGKSSSEGNNPNVAYMGITFD